MNQKHFSLSRIALAVLLTTAPMAAWAATAPDQGTATGFTVLSVGTAIPASTAADATAAVTTTTSTITGDVGSAGAVTLTGSTINGIVVHSGALVNTGSTISGESSPLPVQVIDDFNTAYDSYAAIPCNGTLATAYTGAALTLAPGVYCNDAAVTFTDSTLTLDGQGDANAVWIFKIGTLGTGALTGTNFTVDMVNNGDACNVSWWVAQASTMTMSGFQGSILAGAAITLTGLAGTTTPFNGDIMAKEGVTVTDVTVAGCGATQPPPPHEDHGHHYGQYKDNDHKKCNQGVGNGPEDCDPGNSNLHNPFRHDDDEGSNDEDGGTRGHPGRKGGNDHHDD
jgi:hypothetical protein